jgi:hypothetical protein
LDGVLFGRLAHGPRHCTPGPPPTLRYLAQQAVGIDAECRACRHKAVVGFEQFLDRYGDMTFPDFARLMKCSASGSRHVDVRPAWPSRT